MTNIITKTLRSSFLILAFSLFLNATASAQNCATPPSCEQLGYSMPEIRCSGVSSLKCPFDSTKYFCTAPILIGDILYSDKSFSPNLIASKTPIAIVFDVENRLAIALDYQVKKNVEVSVHDEIPYEIPGVTYEDGKANTKIIIDFIEQYNENNPSEIHYPGVEYAYNYSTKGTSKGEWFLPSAEEAGLLLEKNLVVIKGFDNIGKSIKIDDLFASLTSSIEGDKSIKLPGGVKLPVPNDGYPAFPVIRF